MRSSQPATMARPPASPELKRARQQAIREIVAWRPITSQVELAEALAERGFEVTQATVSRDIAELGLVKVARGERHVYVAPEDLAPAVGAAGAPGAGQQPPGGSSPRAAADERLRRILADIPLTVRRSGLILLLIGTPGTASIVAQAIDDSSLQEQEGTLAGDNTTLVLFADEERLERWLERFRQLQASSSPTVTTEALR
ncbi:MAG TPA: arginine repressor [Candidatus Binatia bacterium]|nr:arginine repressor [Candidatus Binatia bacterium]